MRIICNKRVDDHSRMSRAVVHTTTTTILLFHCQDASECVSEIGVEDGVNDRIEGRIGISEPGQDFEGQR